MRVAEFLDHRAAAGRERADMQRQHDVLRHDFALGVHQRAGSILRFAHDGREAGAEQRVLHLLHDAGERAFTTSRSTASMCISKLSFAQARLSCRACGRLLSPLAGRGAASGERHSHRACDGPLPVPPPQAGRGLVAPPSYGGALHHCPCHDQILPLVHPRGLPRVDHRRAVELVEDRRARSVSPTSSFSRW